MVFKKTLLVFFIFGFCFAPLDVQTVFYCQKNIKALVGSNLSNEVWDVDRKVEGNFIIGDNNTLVIEKGVTVTFEQGAIMTVVGKLDIRGTVKNPVKFRDGDDNMGYSILVANRGEIKMQNVDVQGGGLQIPSNPGGINNQYSRVVKKAYANQNIWSFSYIGVINIFSGGKLSAENCRFHNNMAGFAIENLTDIKVNRSQIFNNVQYDVFNVSDLDVDFKYNWWGSEDGPNEKKINGNVNTNNWRIDKDFHDPVIIVPGILGSWKVNGVWQIDPILKRYDNLYNTFLKNGYEENTDIFTFAYDWHLSNSITAKQLKEKISEIKKKTNWPKVDVVAHSMGGLVVREYLESENYGDDIDELIFLGTPHLGAPKDYLIYEKGEKGFDELGMEYRILKHLFKHEAEEKGYKNIYDYIHKTPIQSAKELLPIYNYLYLLDADEYKKSGKMKYDLMSYPNKYPINSFLEKLNKNDNLEKLKLVDSSNIVGNANNNTITGINLLGTTNQSGIVVSNFQELRFGDGDGTVPIKSAKGIKTDNLIETNFTHGKLPSNASGIVYENITGELPMKKINLTKIKSILLFMVFSPIDIQIIAPDGKRVGKNFETGGFYDEIEGAYYTGYDTDTEFVTIPNPIDGEYKVLTQGTSDGNYKVEATDISQNDNDEVSEQTLIFEGETILDKRYQHQFTIKNSSILNVTVTDTDDDKNVGDGNDEEENITNENESELQSNENSNNELVTTIENDDTGNSKSNKHKKKKNRKKHKSNKVALADTNRDGDNNSAIKSTNENKEQPNSSEKNNPENVVMGEESKNPSDQVATNQVENESKSFYALGAVILIGILLLMGNLFGWSKIKKKKGDNDF